MVHRILSLTASSVLLGTIALAQIPNAGFENWTDAGDYLVPDGWVTFNDLTFPLANVPSCERGAPGAVGAYYARVTTLDVPGIGVMPGLAFTGTDIMAPDGFPMSTRPNTLSGQWMYDVADGDVSVVTVSLSRWNPSTQEREDIGSGAATATGGSLGWETFSMDIEYSSALDPDTATIFLISSGGQAAAGTTLAVDELAFDATTGVDEAAALGLHLFPSPAQDVLNITAAAGITGVSLTDLSGREVLAEGAYGPLTTVNVAGLPAGAYVARIRLADGRITARTFLKQ